MTKYLGIKDKVLDNITVRLRRDTAITELNICLPAYNFWKYYLPSIFEINTGKIQAFLRLNSVDVAWWVRDVADQKYGNENILGSWDGVDEEGKRFKAKYLGPKVNSKGAFTGFYWCDPSADDLEEVKTLTYWTKAILLKYFLKPKEFEKLKKGVMALPIHDVNSDGLDGHDLSAAKIAPGSAEAKAAWTKIDAEAHSPAAVAKAKAAGFEKAVGMYQGKPLIPGEAGAGQGDHQLLLDKLIYSKGFSAESAAKIASKVAQAVKAKVGVASK